MSREVYTFSAGPCIFPLEVLNSVKSKLPKYFNLSHEYPEYIKLEKECKSLISELLNVPKNYEIFFMEGGATGQFAATAINLLGEKGAVGDYLVTGTWSKKAAEDCEKIGGVPNRIMSDDAKVNFFFKI
jgi:phosphoserine aminotransferase